MYSWLILIAAGLCEVVWALGLKVSGGLTKPVESAFTVLFMILSLYLLAVAARQIPISIAYTIWAGVGAVGTFLGGVLLLGEKVNFQKTLFFVMIVVGILGLKVSSIKALD